MDRLAQRVAARFRKADEVETVSEAVDRANQRLHAADDLADMVAEFAGTKRLGQLVVGGKGSEKFGPYMLTWTVTLDGLDWKLSDYEAEARGHQGWMQGYLKYVGWNRFDVVKAPSTGDLEVYVHDYPYFRAALDYLYFGLGAQIGIEGDKAAGNWTDPMVHSER